MLRAIGRSNVAPLILLVLIAIKCCHGAPSVIIVGAGAAGIAAAAKLLENNITNITILEAEGRIGGRIHSVQFGDKLVDLGAQWCHGEKDNLVYELVKDLDVLEPGEVLVNYCLSSREEIDRAFADELFQLYHTIYEEAEQGDGLSLGDYMIKRFNESITTNYGNNPEIIKVALEFLNFFAKRTLSLEGVFSWFDVSAASDYTECEGNQILNWKGHGYKTILDVLMKKYPNPKNQLPIDDKIFLNKEAIKIVWDDNDDNPQGATVECLDGSTYKADYVIFTPSLGVLKDRYETLFQPSLPEEKINAIKELGIGAVVKVFLHFSVKWWPEDNFTDFSFVWTEKDKQNLVKEFPEGPNESGKSWLSDLLGVFVANESPNVLTAWFCGEFVPKIELCSDDIISDGIMFALNKFVGHQFINIPKPDSLLRYGWYSNPHFRGTYSFQTVESRKRGISAEIVLSQPLMSSSGKETLLFAGEATHPKYYSTVHGAIETGHREAWKIISLNQIRIIDLVLNTTVDWSVFDNL